MIVLRNKYFAAQNNLNSPIDAATEQAEPLLEEIIKCIEFYQLNKNMKHWIEDEIVKVLFEQVIRAEFKITDCFVLFEDRVNQPIILKRFSSDIERELHGKDFIEKVLLSFGSGREFYNKYSNPEYREILNNDFIPRIRKNIRTEIEFYQKVMKYIALSISGQIDPEEIYFWDDYKINTTKVNYNSNNLINISMAVPRNISKVIARCIVNVILATGKMNNNNADEKYGIETKSIRELLYS